MLCNYIVDICVSILKKKTCFKILDSINKRLLKSTLISTIIKQRQSFETYNKNINSNSDADRYIYKIDYPSKIRINRLDINVKTLSNLKLSD